MTVLLLLLALIVLPTSGYGDVTVIGSRVDVGPQDVLDVPFILTRADSPIAGVQFDVGYSPSAIQVISTPNGRPDCTVNPGINKGNSSFAFRPPSCEGVDCTAIRTLILSTENVDAIAGGSQLFSCRIRIAPNASDGEYPLAISGLLPSSPEGTRVQGSSIDGAIVVKSVATLAIGSSTGTAGSSTSFDVTLTESKQAIAATQNDVLFDAAVSVAIREDGTPDCNTNPAINKDQSSFSFLPSGCLPGDNCDSIRGLVFSTTNALVIPQGSVLYSCRLSLRFDASGFVPLQCSGVILSSPAGDPLRAQCIDGGVMVPTPTATATATPTATPTPTPTLVRCVGDCDSDESVTVDEIILGVNIALELQPLAECPRFDFDRNGHVTIDEVVKAVNLAFVGCPTL